MITTRQISMIKGDERFIFNYEPGREAELLDCFAEMAKDQRMPFDLFDAAVLTYQLGQRIEI